MNEVPQRRLYIELRLLVDRLCAPTRCSHTRCIAAKGRIVVLERDNPRNFWSTKVLHNIGKRRLLRVLTYVEPTDDEARARVRARLVSKSMRGSRELAVVGGGPTPEQQFYWDQTGHAPWLDV